MQANEVTPKSCLEFKALVYELLGLDPAMLAKMDTETSSVAIGLNLFMRRTLERAIGSIWATDDAIFRLRTDDAAKALGWPDAATMDLSTLFVFALVRAARKLRGLPYIALRPIDAGIAEVPHQKKRLLTAAEGAAVVVELLKEGIFEMRDVSGLGTAQSMSVCAFIQQRLGIKPKDLVRPLYETRREANRAYARDPDGQVILGLAAFLIRLIEVSQAAAAQNIDAIRLLIWDASAGRESLVRLTNISSLLTGGLLITPDRDVAFLVKTPGPAYTANLH